MRSNAVTSDTIKPRVLLDVSNITDADAGALLQEFTVTYSDNVAVDVSSFDAADVTITRLEPVSTLRRLCGSYRAAVTFAALRRVLVHATGGTWTPWTTAPTGSTWVSNKSATPAATLPAVRPRHVSRQLSRVGQLNVNDTTDSVDVNPAMEWR